MFGSILTVVFIFMVTLSVLLTLDLYRDRLRMKRLDKEMLLLEFEMALTIGEAFQEALILYRNNPEKYKDIIRKLEYIAVSQRNTLRKSTNPDVQKVFAAKREREKGAEQITNPKEGRIDGN